MKVSCTQQQEESNATPLVPTHPGEETAAAPAPWALQELCADSWVVYRRDCSSANRWPDKMSWAGSSGNGTDPLPPPPAEQEEDDAMPPLVTGEEAEALYLNQEDVLEEYDISEGKYLIVVKGIWSCLF